MTAQIELDTRAWETTVQKLNAMLCPDLDNIFNINIININNINITNIIETWTGKGANY